MNRRSTVDDGVNDSKRANCRDLTPACLESLSTKARKKNLDKRSGETVSRGKKVGKRAK